MAIEKMSGREDNKEKAEEEVIEARKRTAANRKCGVRGVRVNSGMRYVTL
jgi:hypothetical protein